MYIFTPNTLIKSAEINSNFDNVSNRLAILEQNILEYVLPSTFNSTTTVAFQDTGLKITLPEIGTWLIRCDLRVSSGNIANSYAVLRLYNQTTSTVITNSYRIGQYTGGDVNAEQVTIPLTKVVTTTTSNNIIRVELSPSVANAVGLLSDSNGVSAIIAERKS